MQEILHHVVQARITDPAGIARRLAQRRQRPRVLGPDGTLFLVAADHPARGSLSVGDRDGAMADRVDLLRRLLVALSRPGVDGIIATADIVADLSILGALDDKIVFGSMNRGGLAGARFELDDGFTCYTADALSRDHLDGGKMMVRIDDSDPGTLRTLESCARAIDQLSRFSLPAMVEVFAVHRAASGLHLATDSSTLARAISIASALGSTSAYTWLKVPVVEDTATVIAATTLPTFLLGGDPGTGSERTFARWREAMSLPQVRGLVVGRTILYPPDDNIVGAVDQAVRVIADVHPSHLVGLNQRDGASEADNDVRAKKAGEVDVKSVGDRGAEGPRVPPP